MHKNYYFSVNTSIFHLGLKGSEIALLIAILAKSKNTNYESCFPSVEELSEMIGVCEKTVRRIIDRLEEKQIIISKARYSLTHESDKYRQTTNLYVLSKEKMSVPTHEKMSVHNKGFELTELTVDDDKKENAHANKINTPHQPVLHSEIIHNCETNNPELTNELWITEESHSIPYQRNKNHFLRVAEIKYGIPHHHINHLVSEIDWGKYSYDAVEIATETFFKRILTGKTSEHRVQPILNHSKWLKQVLENKQQDFVWNYFSNQTEDLIADTTQDVFDHRSFKEIHHGVLWGTERQNKHKKGLIQKRFSV